MKFITLVCLLGFTTLIQAQTPQAFNYQAIVRNSDGTPIEDREISVQISILREDSTVYQEEHFGVETRSGLFSISVGDEDTNDDFSAIDWRNGAYYLEVKVDKNGGTDFANIGEKARLLSVPYALYAQNSGNIYWMKIDSTENIHYSNGRVGIGTVSPKQELHISQNDGSNADVRLQTSGAGYMDVFSGNEKGGLLIKDDRYMVFGTNGIERVRIINNRMGVGTNNPRSPFHLHTPSDDNGLRITTQDNQEEIRLHLAGNANDPPEDHYGFLSLGGGTKLRGNGHPSVFTGKVEVDVLQINGGGDGAEYFNIRKTGNLEPGSLVVIDDESAGKLKVSSRPYDTRVAGVISGAGGVRPGITLEQEEVLEGDELVSLWGRVYVKATTENGKVKPGDLLTSSNIPGHVMKARKKRKSRGAVIGKALSSLEDGEGLVLLLIQPQ